MDRNGPLLQHDDPRPCLAVLQPTAKRRQRKPIPKHIHIPPPLDRVDEPVGISNDILAGVGPPEDMGHNPRTSRPYLLRVLIHFPVMGRREARRQGDGVALLIGQMKEQGRQITVNQGGDCRAGEPRQGVLVDHSGMDLGAKAPRGPSGRRARGDWL